MYSQNKLQILLIANMIQAFQLKEKSNQSDVSFL